MVSHLSIVNLAESHLKATSNSALEHPANHTQKPMRGQLGLGGRRSSLALARCYPAFEGGWGLESGFTPLPYHMHWKLTLVHCVFLCTPYFVLYLNFAQTEATLPPNE